MTCPRSRSCPVAAGLRPRYSSGRKRPSNHCHTLPLSSLPAAVLLAAVHCSTPPGCGLSMAWQSRKWNQLLDQVVMSSGEWLEGVGCSEFSGKQGAKTRHGRQRPSSEDSLPIRAWPPPSAGLQHGPAAPSFPIPSASHPPSVTAIPNSLLLPQTSQAASLSAMLQKD